MDKCKIVIAVPLEQRHLDYLAEKASGGEYTCEFTDVTKLDLAGAEAQAAITDADVIIGNLPLQHAKKAAHLKWMQLNSAGANPYADPGSLPSEVQLTNASGTYGLTVSEHMLALTFALIRHIGPYRMLQEQHIWKKFNSIISVEGSTIVVLGMGDIGTDYARKVKAMGAYVIGVRKHLKDKPECFDEQFTVDDLDQVLPRADIVAMVLPGAADTAHLLDERRLRLMKPGSYLLNVGRGSAIDPAGLKAVLAEGLLGGVGLDVTEPEPLPPDDPLWDDPAVLITPHAAGGFSLPETRERFVRVAGENLYAFTHNGSLKNLVEH